MSKVLLADDDPFLIQIYSTRLNRDGHQVICCADGQQALNQIQEQNPDLVVLDIMLPKLNGLDVLTAIKENKQLAKIPVVILSNLSHAEEQEEAKRRGATEFLAKIDYSPSQVVKALQKYLSKPSVSNSTKTNSNSDNNNPKDLKNQRTPKTATNNK